jgi:hypothetical protein
VIVTSGEAHDRVVEKVKKDPGYLNRLREMFALEQTKWLPADTASEKQNVPLRQEEGEKSHRCTAYVGSMMKKPSPTFIARVLPREALGVFENSTLHVGLRSFPHPENHAARVFEAAGFVCVAE